MNESNTIYAEYINDLKTRNRWDRPPKYKDAGMDKWGTERLKLAVTVKDILNKLKLTWFIDNGTLLGAWRSGKFIKHDDDFDIGLYVPEYTRKYAKSLSDIITLILPSPYKCRQVTSYCDKLEIYDPTCGNYILQEDIYDGANFHFVTIDLQFYMNDPSNKSTSRILHKFNFQKMLDSDILSESSQITLEGVAFNAPIKPEEYLKTVYGYLGKDYCYDPLIGLFIKKSDF